MNASRLRSLMELLLRFESLLSLQSKVSELNDRLGALASQPQNPQVQTDYVSTLESAKKTFEQVRIQTSPAQARLFAEVGADKFFSNDITAELVRLIAENPASPAVAHKRWTEFVSERQTFINEITQALVGLRRMNIEEEKLNDGEAEIGFQIPRELFSNELGGLIKELEDVEFIVRAFSEAESGSYEEPKIGQISTSDPTIFLQCAYQIVTSLAKAFRWALDVWKQVEEIRDIRTRAAQVEALKNSEIEEAFDKKIQQQIADAVAKKTKEIVETAGGGGRSKTEKEKHISTALESILAHVERGMTVEVRFLPPARADAAEGAEPNPIPPELSELERIAPTLVFPEMKGTPVLALPKTNAVTEPKPAAKKAT